MIADEYLVNWMVDNLPAATKYSQTGVGKNMSFTFWATNELLLQCCLFVSGSDYSYMNGFLLGIAQKGKYYLHNHVSLDRAGDGHETVSVFGEVAFVGCEMLNDPCVLGS